MIRGAPPTRKSMLRQWRHKLALIWHRIRSLDDRPHRIAGGIALGFFIGWLPIVGIQMLTCLGLSLLARFSFVATLPGVWMSNPITMIPMYLLINWVGGTFAGERVTWSRMEQIWTHINELIATHGFGMGVWEGILYLFSEAVWSATIAMFIGGVIIGTINAAIVYVPALRLVQKYQHRREHRRGNWSEKHRALRLTKSAAAREPGAGEKPPPERQAM